MDSEAQGPERLWPMAVRADGRRSLGAPSLDDADAALPGPAGALVVLDHAGPRSARWSSERALGATDHAEPETGRRPRPLDDADWRELGEAFARGAEAVRRAGCTPILGIDDDGLLQAALSPWTGVADGVARLQLVLAIHRACGPVDVALCVEELAPGGLDASDGIEAARALHAQGARTVFASAGSHAFPPLLTRAKGRSVGDPALALRSAAWLVGRVPVRVVAVVDGDPASLRTRALALGLAGVAARGTP